MKALKNVLVINGITSGATGLLLIVFAKFFAEIFAATEVMPFVGVGVFLVLFAVLVLSQGLKVSPREKMVLLISVLDISWVVGSVAIVVLQLFSLSSVGYVLIAAVAAWVSLMAILQLKGVRRMSPS